MNHVSVEIFSRYGKRLFSLEEGTEEGSFLSLTMREVRRGGVSSASFRVKDSTRIQLYRGAQARVRYAETTLALLDILEKPEGKSDNGLITINATGVSERLRTVTIQDTLTAISIKNALLSYATEALSVGIVMASADIDLPTTVNVTDLELDNKTLFDVIELLVSMAEEVSVESAYRWYVDADKNLIVKNVIEDPIETVFEGYQFNSPNVVTSYDGLVNSVKLYRKTELSDKTEYVDTYSVSASIDRYGLYEKKLVLDYYASTADCARIANGYLARSKEPVTIVALNKMDPRQTYNRKSIRLSPYERDEELYSGSDLTRLETGRSFGVVYSTVNDSPIGLKSTKCAVSSFASGFVELQLQSPLSTLRSYRVWLKASAVSTVDLFIVDKYGDASRTSVPVTTEWTLFTITVAQNEWNIVTALVDEYAHYVSVDADHDYALYYLTKETTQGCAAIRLAFVTKGVDVFISRVDARTTQWKNIESVPASIAYKWDKGTLTASVSCGADERTADSELTDIWKTLRGNIV